MSSCCLAGTTPICWCLHPLRYPQPSPYPLGISGPGHGPAVLGQHHLSCPLGPHPLCRWGPARLHAAISLQPGPLSPILSPAAGEWGWPLLTSRALAVGIAMAMGCSMNSVGCYVLCGRLLRAPQLPPDACNRGLCTEGLGSLLAGLLGAPGGTAASIANACAAGLTQVWLGLGGGSARDGEAMEQEGWVTCSTQAVTRSSLGKAGLYGRMGGNTTRQSGERRSLSSLSCPFYQTGSRLSVQVSALACVVLGMSPRLVRLLTCIPLAVHGGYSAIPLHFGACSLPGTT